MMDFLTALMLSITATLATLGVPMLYMHWLDFHELQQEEEPEQLRLFLSSLNEWMQLNFRYAVFAVIMVLVTEGSALTRHAPYLSRVTAVYAVVSLAIAFVESLLAQRVATVLVSWRGGAGRRSDIG